MAGSMSVGALIMAAQKDKQKLVNDASSRDNKKDTPRKTHKRKAKDPLGSDSPVTKRQKVTGRPQKNPYQVFSNLLPRARKHRVAKMPRSPAVIRCEGCQCVQAKHAFDCEGPCHRRHLPKYCKVCTKAHINDALLRGALMEAVHCNVCQTFWGEKYLSRFFTTNMKEIYVALAKKAKNYRQCLAFDCSHGQLVHTGPNFQPQVVCDACGAISCFIHRVHWHTGVTCGQYFDKLFARVGIRHHKTLEMASNEASAASKGCPICERSLSAMDDTNAKIYCNECDMIVCAYCLVDQEQIDNEGAHRHNKLCRFWAHPPWDNDGDVKAGLKQLRSKNQAGKKNQANITAALAAAQPYVMPSSSSLSGSANTNFQGFLQTLSHLNPLAYFTPLPSNTQFYATGPHTGVIVTGHEPHGDITVAGDNPNDQTVEEEIVGEHKDKEIHW